MVIDIIKATHQWNTTEGFIADGLICPESYKKSNFKIAVLLGESYGYDECGVTDIERQVSNDILGVHNYKVKTPRKVSALVSLIFESLQKKELLTREQLPRLFLGDSANLSRLCEYIKNIAWINVKKASRHYGTRQNPSEIYRNAKRNEEVLKLQVQSIDPDLMIVCSAPVFNSLFDMKLLGENIQSGKKCKVQVNTSGKYMIELSHPSYCKDWGYDGLYQIYKAIVTGVRPELR